MKRFASILSLAFLTLGSVSPRGEDAQAAEQPWYTAAVVDAPALHGPANGTLLQGFGAITLSFDLPDGSTQYHLQVIPFHGDGPGVNLIRNPESSFTLQPPTLGIGPYVLLPGMTYTWRLRASDATTSISDTDRSWGPWSDEWSFTTPQASTASIRPADPPPGVTVSSLTPSLSWTDDNAFIFYYEIQLSKDELFDTNPRTAIAPVFFNLVHGGESRPFNSWAVPAAYPLEQGCKYYWRVRPRVQGNGAPPNWPPSFWFVAPAREGVICPSGQAAPSPFPSPSPSPSASPSPSPSPPPSPAPSPFTLIVTTQGTGSGSVTSLPAGINCPPDCSEQYPAGQVVTLTAIPLGGSYFQGWAGDSDCSDGTLIMTTTTSCIAIFQIGTSIQLPTLIVNKSGSGSGTVTSSPPGINCGFDCSETYAAGTVVSLTALPASGSQFAGWTGDPDCTDGQVTMNSSKTCTALFESTGTPPPTFTPTPTQPATAVPPTSTPTPTRTPTSTPTATATPTPSGPTGIWTQRAPRPTAGSAFACAEAGGKVYVVGGGEFVEVYDPQADSWSKKAQLPSVRLWHAAAGGANGKIYTFGGSSNSSPSATVQEYDPVSDSWSASALAPMPIGVRDPAAVAASDGKIYVIGGWTGSTSFGAVQAYDPAANAWVTGLAPMPTGRWGHAAALGPDGRIYVAGGAAGFDGTEVSSVEVYNPAANTWQTRAALPTKRVYTSGAFGSNGRFYVIGGWLYGTGTHFSTVESYDPGSNAWRTEPSTSVPKNWACGVAIGGGSTLLSIGGGNNSGPINVTESYRIG